MANTIKLIVYPVNDLEAAKTLFSKFLGLEPYADAPYYVGYRPGDIEVGLDPNGHDLVAYVDVADIKAYLDDLVSAGATLLSEPKEVGGGLLVAQVKDSNGNVLGLRQSVEED